MVLLALSTFLIIHELHSAFLPLLSFSFLFFHSSLLFCSSFKSVLLTYTDSVFNWLGVAVALNAQPWFLCLFFGHLPLEVRKKYKSNCIYWGSILLVHNYVSSHLFFFQSHISHFLLSLPPLSLSLSLSSSLFKWWTVCSPTILLYYSASHWVCCNFFSYILLFIYVSPCTSEICIDMLSSRKLNQKTNQMYIMQWYDITYSRYLCIETVL